MAASNEDDDSYVLPKVPSDDDAEDSEDKKLKSNARHVHDTGCEVDRDPVKPEAKAKVLPVAAASALQPLLTLLYLQLLPPYCAC